MSPPDKPLAWLHGAVKTPPFSKEARLATGFLLRRLQKGETLGMPHARPVPSIGPHCHELRISDGPVKWRIIYRVDQDAIVVADIFKKKTQKTPKDRIAVCKERLRRYDDA